MKLNWRRTLMPAAALLAALAPARAQQQPPPAAAPAPAVQQNPVCARLETQLQTFDRTNNDAARADQLGKFEAAAANQQTEIDRQEATSRRMGCAQNRFFMMLSNQPQQCTPLNNKIQQMRDNLEKIQADAERLRGEPPPEREGQRRTILAALAQSNCGAQYQQQAAAPPPRRAGLFESLFGPKSAPGEPSAPGGGDVPGMSTPAGSYRTVCVRTCDGFYYPISYATNAARFAEDEKTCRASCPAAEVQLYSSPTGGSINDAVSVNAQQPYTALPNAFRYRTSLDQACSCRHPGESWSQALKSIDDPTVEQGDIVVNDQKARQLSAPRGDAQGRPIRQPPAPARLDPRTAQTTAQPAAQATAPAPAEPKTDADDAPSKPDPNRKVRDVGPTFLPGR
jgi:hypothetical protein